MNDKQMPKVIYLERPPAPHKMNGAEKHSLSKISE